MKKAFAVVGFMLISLFSAFSQDLILNQLMEEYASQNNVIFEALVEGNFTGSGKTEIIASFETQGLPMTKCFICDSEKIIKEYNLKGCYMDKFYITEKPRNLVPELGIRYEIAIVGDINNNKLDEIYYFEPGTRTPQTFAYEFVDGAFKKILNTTVRNDFDYTTVDSVDKANKTIAIREGFRFEDSYIRCTYTWNEEKKEFVRGKDGVHYYFNKDSNDWEPANGDVMNFFGTYYFDKEKQLILERK